MSGLTHFGYFLAVVALLGSALGAGLLLFPSILLHLYYGSVLARLDSPVRVERFIYRHHKLFGAFIALAAGFSSFSLLALLMEGRITNPWAAGSIALLTANLAALALGIVIFIRPSLLKGLENTANRWFPSLGKSRGQGRESALAQVHLLGATLLGTSLLLLVLLSRYVS